MCNIINFALKNGSTYQIIENANVIMRFKMNEVREEASENDF